MTTYYFDTSALVKRYFDERGTKWVRERINPTNPQDVFTVHITGPEFVSAFIRKVNNSDIPQSEALRAIGRFKEDFRTWYHIVEVTQQVIDHAMELAQKHRLRGYDSVQLAAASEIHQFSEVSGIQTFVFVCADNDLIEAAQTEGLNTENPNNYA